ncbi:MAG: CS1-pili formation C-terminal domain-containing protein [Iodobacter sp.]
MAGSLDDKPHAADTSAKPRTIKKRSETPSSSELLISQSMHLVLQSGIDVPLLIKNRESGDAEQQDIVLGYAQIAMDKNRLMLRSVRIDPNPQDVVLTAELQAQLGSLRDAALSDLNTVYISDAAELRFDTVRLYAVLEIDKSGFGIKPVSKSSLLGASSSSDLSGVFNYNVNATHSSGNGYSQNTAYMGFTSVQSMGEHHLLADGSVYTPGTSGGKNVVLDRLMYERDFQGHRLALGMMDGWSLQSSGLVSTLNGTQMLGFSYGNSAQSYQQDFAQSLTPINVYFPSAGEAHIYRNGRLLGVRQMAMGNHEVDASALPGGIYDVQVDVVVAGKVVSSGSYRVNKPASQSGRGNDLSWQVWGGAGRDSRVYGLDDGSGKQQEGRYRGLGGVSLAGRVWETDWNTSVYYNRETLVEEAHLSRKIFGEVQIDLQNLMASDGTRRNMLALNAPLPDGWGNVSYRSEHGKTGSRLDYYIDSREGVGLSLNLGKLNSRLGSLNMTYDQVGGSADGTREWRWDYNQQLYSGRMGVVSMNLGSSQTRNSNNGSQSQLNSRYLMLNLTIPMDADFSVAYSQNDNSNSLDLSAGKSFDGPLTYAGANLSQQRYSGSAHGPAVVSYDAYANFSTKMGSGTVSTSGGDGRSSVSATSTGSVGWSQQGMGFGGSTGTSGVVIDVPVADSNGLEARINEQSYYLSSGRNFVPLSAYKQYKVQVLPSGDSDLSYEVESQPQEITLYPGNVARYQYGVKQMVTVFGRLVRPDGQPLVGAKMRNHIGTAVTSEDGSFSIDIDNNTPELEVESAMTGRFMISVDLHGAHGALLLNDVVWTGKQVKATPGQS